MYYALKPDFELRGWKDAPCAIVQKGVVRPLFLTEEGFHVAKLCDGKSDMEKEKLTKIQKETLEYFVDNGIIAKSEKPLKINENQEYFKYPAKYMKSCQWSITGRCNYKCKHCYICGADDKFGELSYDDCEHIVAELAKCGIRELAITGGEPLVHKDFWKIIDRVLQEDIVITQIYSNGYLITDEFLDELEKRGLHNIMMCISYDGKRFHDWLRGVPGAEKYATDAIERASKRGFFVACEMSMHEDYLDDLRENVNNLAKIGCRNIKAGVIDNSGAWKENGYGKDTNFDKIFEKIVEYIPKFYEDGAPIDMNLAGIFEGEKGKFHYSIPLDRNSQDPEEVCLCDHIRQDVYISPEGKVLPCFLFAALETKNQYKSILETPLEECLEDAEYVKLTETKASEMLKQNKECAKCQYGNRCLGGCRGKALQNDEKDSFGKDMSCCVFYKHGWSQKVRLAATEAIEKYAFAEKCRNIENIAKNFFK